MATLQSEIRRGEVVSSVRVAFLGGHAHIDIWSRGGKAGAVVVDADDAEHVMTRLGGGGRWSLTGLDGSPAAVPPSESDADFVRRADYAGEMLAVLESIENDAGQVPDWLWSRIRDVVAKAGGRPK